MQENRIAISDHAFWLDVRDVVIHASSMEWMIVQPLLSRCEQTDVFTNFGDDVPVAVLHEWTAISSFENIFAEMAKRTESERITDSTSSVPRSTNEALAIQAKIQFSNSELIDGQTYNIDQVQSFETKSEGSRHLKHKEDVRQA